MKKVADFKKMVDILVRKMLENGADINYRSENDITPLHIASFIGNIELAELLVTKGARLESPDKEPNSKKAEPAPISLIFCYIY